MSAAAASSAQDERIAARYGSIEAGGTKFVCAIGSGPDAIEARERIATVRPEGTLQEVLDFFERHDPVEAVGIASFGPLELRTGHPQYGHITSTPKPGWTGADLVGPIAAALEVPIALETDVNGAGLGEWRWGAGRGLDNLVYLTIGTGLGGGAIVGGRPVNGLVHPEMGHISVERLEGDDFPGVCPYHGDCFEGMACGPSLEKRWGRKGQELGDLLDEAIDVEAHYVAAGIRNLVYALAPQRVIVGGGVGQMPGLAEAVESKLLDMMNGYAVQPEHSDQFVVRPALGDDAGIAGGFVLAEQAAHGR